LKFLSIEEKSTKLLFFIFVLLKYLLQQPNSIFVNYTKFFNIVMLVMINRMFIF